MAQTALPAPCKWCGLTVAYDQPGNPPGDCQTGDLQGMYYTRPASRNFTLVTSAGVGQCFGAGAQHQAGVAIGQFAHHEVAGLNGS